MSISPKNETYLLIPGRGSQGLDLVTIFATFPKCFSEQKVGVGDGVIQWKPHCYFGANKFFVMIQGVFFLTLTPDFQYQNEKQVAANQAYFFNKFSM